MPETDRTLGKGPLKITRLHIENALYRIIKLSLIYLAVLTAGFGGYKANYDLTWVELGALFAALRLALALRLPSSELKPLSYQRIDIPAFLKKEIIFILLVSAVLFLFDIYADRGIVAKFLVANFMLQSTLYALWVVYNKFFIRPQNLRRASASERTTIIVGAGKRGMNAADIILKHPDLNTRIIGFVDFHKTGLWRYRDIPLIGGDDEIEQIILKDHVDYVIMATEPEDHVRSQGIFRRIEATGTRLIILPCIYNQAISRCYTSSLNGTPVLLYQSSPACRGRLFAKEVMDRVGGLVGMIISAPVMALAALLIRLESRGPIFFKQVRSGINGRPFMMYKLRTMVADADRLKSTLKHLNEMSGPVFKIKEDPRVTRIGRILRKLSLDELPQFYNVFRGDMSLVGPRPPLPSEVEKYQPWQRRKLSVKPGLTCIWQVNGRNNVDFDDWMRQDLEYIDNWSLAKDAELIIKTIPAVLKAKGAC
jgi:exopolysaccharide biosynthesis polyprenyl glycosylphosphotransferase